MTAGFKLDPSTKTIRVVATVTIEVDRAKYEEEYGEKETYTTIRQHVVGVVGTAAESAFEHIDAVTVEGVK